MDFSLPHVERKSSGRSDRSDMQAWLRTQFHRANRNSPPLRINRPPPPPPLQLNDLDDLEPGPGVPEWQPVPTRALPELVLPEPQVDSLSRGVINVLDHLPCQQPVIHRFQDPAERLAKYLPVFSVDSEPYQCPLSDIEYCKKMGSSTVDQRSPDAEKLFHEYGTTDDEPVIVRKTPNVVKAKRKPRR